MLQPVSQSSSYQEERRAYVLCFYKLALFADATHPKIFLKVLRSPSGGGAPTVTPITAIWMENYNLHIVIFLSITIKDKNGPKR